MRQTTWRVGWALTPTISGPRSVPRTSAFIESPPRWTSVTSRSRSTSGPRVDTTGLPVERQVRHALETARALSARNRTDDALAAVLAAEQKAPEQVRHHAISRQLVQVWMRRGR